MRVRRNNSLQLRQDEEGSERASNPLTAQAAGLSHFCELEEVIAIGVSQRQTKGETGVRMVVSSPEANLAIMPKHTLIFLPNTPRSYTDLEVLNTAIHTSPNWVGGNGGGSS